ncbi:MAG: molybdenum cofactor guanylyltransferase [Haliangiales bacterium]
MDPQQRDSDHSDEVAAVILCGGRARRLGGRVKALIEVAGETVLARQRAVLAPQVSALALSANDPAPFASTGLPVIADATPDQGPLAGVAAALAWSPAPFVLIVAGDMPYLSPALIALLLAARVPAGEVGDSAAIDAVVPYIGGLPEPLLALYSRSCLAAAERRLAAGRRKTSGLVTDEGLRIRTIGEAALRAVDPDLKSFTNLNTVSDLRGQRSAR